MWPTSYPSTRTTPPMTALAGAPATATAPAASTGYIADPRPPNRATSDASSDTGPRSSVWHRTAGRVRDRAERSSPPPWRPHRHPALAALKRIRTALLVSPYEPPAAQLVADDLPLGLVDDDLGGPRVGAVGVAGAPDAAARPLARLVGAVLFRLPPDLHATATR